MAKKEKTKLKKKGKHIIDGIEYPDPVVTIRAIDVDLEAETASGIARIECETISNHNVYVQERRLTVPVKETDKIKDIETDIINTYLNGFT